MVTVRTTLPQPPLMLRALLHNMQVTLRLRQAGWCDARLAETFPDVWTMKDGKGVYKPKNRDVSMRIPMDAVPFMDADEANTWTDPIYAGWVITEESGQ